MLTLRKTKAAFGLDLAEGADAPPLADGEVLVRVENAGICGSDVHAYEWTDGYDFMVPHLPVTMGHEFAGRIEAVRGDVALPAGTAVTVMPGIACGSCLNCLRDDRRNCLRRRTIGLTCHGGFARYVALPAANCLPLPAGVDTELGALTEPLGVGCEAVLTGEVGLGDTVLVMGPGTIGQAIALFARAAGAGRVLIAGRADAPRFDVMRELGFDDLLDVAEAPLLDLVMAGDGRTQGGCRHRGYGASPGDRRWVRRPAHGRRICGCRHSSGSRVAAADRLRAGTASTAGDAWLRPLHLGQSSDHTRPKAGKLPSDDHSPYAAGPRPRGV